MNNPWARPSSLMGAFLLSQRIAQAPFTMGQKLYLSIQDVAARFGVNATTVYHLAQQGALPGFKVGNQWRFSEEMLEVWVAEQVHGKHARKRGGH